MSFFFFFVFLFLCFLFFFFQAEDGIRDLVRSRGLGDVYKRQAFCSANWLFCASVFSFVSLAFSCSIFKACFSTSFFALCAASASNICLLYTSDAADERSSVDLGGRRIIKKKNTHNYM